MIVISLRQIAKSARASSSQFWTACALGLLAVAVIRLRQAERAVGAQQQAAAELARSSAMMKLERDALVRGLLTSDDDSVFLSGTIAQTGRGNVVSSTRDGLYYVISVHCSACALNLEYLSNLQDSGLVRVTGLSRADPIDSVRRYASQNHVTFPILTNVTGRLVDRLPRHGVPVPVLIRNGAAREMYSGKLSDSSRSSLRAVFARRTSPGTTRE